MPGQYTTESTQRQVQKAVRCTAYGKGFLFFLQIHITGVRPMVSRLRLLCLGLGILSTVMGCAAPPPPMAPLRATLSPVAPPAVAPPATPTPAVIPLPYVPPSNTTGNR